MDSRLQRVGGTRLVHLRYSDAPRVALAIVDAEFGKARVFSGLSHDTLYVEFVRDKFYTVVVRGDDWKRIFPFLRYSDALYKPVIPPANQPPPIPSPQPNRTMQQPPENPAGGLTSFLEGFAFDEYAKIQRLLTTTSVNSTDSLSPPGVPLSQATDGVDLIPQKFQTDFSDFRQATMYNSMVALLQQLFPTDFPTRV
jgi:hypothetical protein